MKTRILFKKLRADAEPPVRAHDGDAGWDVRGVREDNPFPDMAVYGTGLAFAVPRGCWLDVRARSSVYRTGMVLCNGVGTVDSAYRGEVKAMFYRVQPQGTIPYASGERVAQLVPMPCRADEVEFVEVDELPPSWDGRGEGGFGSTGA
jgi:dUTP pyrophosphatase